MLLWYRNEFVFHLLIVISTTTTHYNILHAHTPDSVSFLA